MPRMRSALRFAESIGTDSKMNEFIFETAPMLSFCLKTR